MKNKTIITLLIICLSCLFQCSKTDTTTGNTTTRTITDASGRTVEIPSNISNVICSGPGCLRMLTYLQGLDMVVAVDSIEKKGNKFESRPYALANPELSNLPLFGEFRGHDNPELILSLEKQPDVIFKTYPKSGYDPQKLQEKTGIPVIVLNYGNLGSYKEDFFQSLNIMANVISKEKRAQEVINFFNNQISELNKLSSSISTNETKSCYVGGIAYRGPHGLQSTEPSYPPFKMVNANNCAAEANTNSEITHADISKESLLKWNPEIIFIDISTIQSPSKVNAFYELENDPVYKQLNAQKNKNIYGLLPYNWYTKNYGSILADAWFIGSILYPQKFKDIDPIKKADEIYTFLTGKPVFSEMNKNFQNLAFKKVY